MIPLSWYLTLSAALFSIGIFGVLSRRNAVAILLYVPNIHIFPQQIDGPWNFYKGGDSDTLARLDKWSDDLARTWRVQIRGRQ